LHSSSALASSTIPQQHKTAPLHAAVQVVWPGDSAPARAKRAAAAFLLSRQTYGAASSPVATAVTRDLGTTTQQAGLGPFRQFLQQDCFFRVENTLGSEAWIVLLHDRCDPLLHKPSFAAILFAARPFAASTCLAHPALSTERLQSCCTVVVSSHLQDSSKQQLTKLH
jgi:hypothetical protein